MLLPMVLFNVSRLVEAVDKVVVRFVRVELMVRRRESSFSREDVREGEEGGCCCCWWVGGCLGGGVADGVAPAEEEGGEEEMVRSSRGGGVGGGGIVGCGVFGEDGEGL